MSVESEYQRNIRRLLDELGARVTADLLSENNENLREAVVNLRLEQANPRAFSRSWGASDYKPETSKLIDHYVTIEDDEEQQKLFYVKAITTTFDSDLKRYKTRLSCELMYSADKKLTKGTNWTVPPELVEDVYPNDVHEWQGRTE